MSDDYTNLDLDTAEALLIAAGRPELAQALRYQAQGVRNLVQGEWGMSFVNALEALLTKHVKPIADEIGGLRRDTNALQAEFREGLSGVQATVDSLQTQMLESRADRQALRDELAAVRSDVEIMKMENAADIKMRLECLETDVARFELIEASLAQLVARIGGALPTEADQELSAALRVDDAGRRGDGDG